VTRRRIILYLDQNAWIALAHGAWDKDEHPREYTALKLVCEALNSDDVVIPLSFTNQYETMKINNPVRRAHLARVQVTVSGGRVLRGRRPILEVMLSRYIAEAAGLPVPDVRGEWFLSDLWFETVENLTSGVFENMVSPEAIDYVREHPQETLYDYLAHTEEGTRQEAVRRFSAASQSLIDRMTLRRRNVQGESFALRLRAYSAELLLDETDNILALARQLGLPWQDISDFGAKLAKRLVAEVPIMNVERQLAVRLEDQSRAVEENDLRDMATFVTTLPLVDIVVAEKQFVNLSQQANLDKVYGTHLLTTIHDITPDMLATTAL
jgi:hypothetical protein